MVSMWSCLSLGLSLIPRHYCEHIENNSLEYLEHATQTAGKLAKNAKVAKAFAKAENVLTLSRTGKWLAKSTIMGVSMRHMENFREAAETYKVALDKNHTFLGKGNNLEEFLNSGEGEKFKSEMGIDDNKLISPEMVSNYLASNAATHSYNMNWANVGFDILQSALFLRGGRIGGTRTGMMSRPSSATRKAQNATMKSTSFRRAA